MVEIGSSAARKFLNKGSAEWGDCEMGYMSSTPFSVAMPAQSPSLSFEKKQVSAASVCFDTDWPSAHVNRKYSQKLSFAR
ncbi:hypothetical protein GN244_ATG10574 [Phytophthora infestans]|uniref:Uncharacterized protein n=1 Tax=Phytophthora infestans TaxID=4787 RepID=A0A833TAB9_PHYIN|nr:hypothetical protein GN244_ATG10574 [Phytophthora infestans]KAF4135552.1 hypothetical protein GN958_ATG15246 [Phytophthora infestans]KAF4135553.1 hypothetical protein GN958_ATG15247 [Phytophthora infestans]